MKTYSVYILANATRMLYVGVTNDLDRRVWEHKKKLVPGFAARYGLDSLVYFETFSSIEAAIAREKRLKGWLRSKKLTLVSAANPSWTDLAATHFNKLRIPIEFPTQPIPAPISKLSS
ncbi:MAG: GIY-YIG nuclease family protein [Acidobacteria bacterium]|nr:GIY-YIG nuclease family protein [Acidobacteriota bacterium]